jgi:hypothetical protein
MASPCVFNRLMVHALMIIAASASASAMSPFDGNLILHVVHIEKPWDTNIEAAEKWIHLDRTINLEI